MQGSTQPLHRFHFPKKLTEEGHTKKLIKFNLSDVTGDQRLSDLLPAKANDFYHLSEFYKDFTNFQVKGKNFSKTLGFQDTSYRFSENEISDIFKVHVLYTNSAGTQYFFDFLPVFKFSKERGMGESFKEFFTLIYRKTKQKSSKEKKNFKDVSKKYLLCNQ